MTGQNLPQTAEKDAAETYCYRWVFPAIWPHAVRNIYAVRTTDDLSRVTCQSCLHTLGSQKYPPAHDCATCEKCLHDGAKCCGCYDGACCVIPPGSTEAGESDA